MSGHRKIAMELNLCALRRELGQCTFSKVCGQTIAVRIQMMKRFIAKDYLGQQINEGTEGG